MRFLFSWLKEFVEIPLPPDALAHRLTLAGTEVTSLKKVGSDWLFEAEVTPNRPDLLSHLGLAREVAAILGHKFRLPVWLKEQFHPSWKSLRSDFPILLEDPQGCRRYVGIVIEGVEIKPSPTAVAERLIRLGIRPINNVVDATNFCLMELGQPFHAFDLDRLEGSQIHVRLSRTGETLKLIDGTTCSLTPEFLVIADEKKPVALAGVMGGQETEIGPQTKRILLEAAWFDPRKIRRATFRTKLTSDSSYRFERGVDLSAVAAAAVRAVHLILQLAGGKVTQGPIDVGEKTVPARRISLNPKQAQEVLGMRITAAAQRKFLQRVNCQVSGSVRRLQVEPPSFRPDLRIPEDLHEELARLAGYDRCPATLPAGVRVPVTADWKLLEEPAIQRQDRIRELLVSAGLQEIMTFSLVSPEDQERVGWVPAGSAPIEVRNPLSIENSQMRQTLLVGALQTAARNLNRKTAEGMQLFEWGHVYQAKGARLEESKALSLLAAGSLSARWGNPAKGLGVYHLKGIIQFLCERLRLGCPTQTVETAPKPFESPAIRLDLGGQLLGWTGKIPLKLLEKFEIPEGIPAVYAELNGDLLLTAAPQEIKVTELSKIPPVARDLAIVIAEAISQEEIRQVIEASGKPLLRQVELFDLYRGQQISSGKKSLAFRLTFSASDRTLTDEEIADTHQKIVQALQQQFQATLR